MAKLLPRGHHDARVPDVGGKDCPGRPVAERYLYALPRHVLPRPFGQPVSNLGLTITIETARVPALNIKIDKQEPFLLLYFYDPPVLDSRRLSYDTFHEHERTSTYEAPSFISTWFYSCSSTPRLPSLCTDSRGEPGSAKRRNRVIKMQRTLVSSDEGNPCKWTA